MKPRVRLAYLVSHPIQYQAPLLRRLAQEPDIDLTVLFGSDFSAREYKDQGFGVKVAWDVPLLEGYRSRVLPPWRDDGTVSATRPFSRNLLGALTERPGQPAFDALWVHGYASVNALRGIAWARALGMPVLLRAEGWAGDRPRSGLKLAAKRAFFRLLRGSVSATLPIGSRNAAYWQESLGTAVPQFPVPYAVDNGFFARAARKAAAQISDLRQTLGLTAGQPIILFASKLQARKHADHLLEAFLFLREKLTDLPALLIAGDGEERAKLETYVRTHGLTDHVQFLGFQNQTELPRLFALADVFVLPSRHEPWGLIVNEAMASGCPVIASSDVGAAPDLIREGVTGYTFPVGDIGALSRALLATLAPPGHARQLGLAAAAHIASWDYEADIRGLRNALAFTTGKIRP